MTPNHERAYKYQWARYVTRDKLEADFETLNLKLSAALHFPPASNITELWNRVQSKHKILPPLGEPPKVPGEFKVGIVGSGISGLFTAMILDYLRSEVEGINIGYDVLEAAGKERLGGRLLTKWFSDRPHDYYDVGAMRFPDSPIMARAFKLFRLLGLDRRLIPYYMDDEKNVCPSYFNDVRVVGRACGPDPFHINRTLPIGSQIPRDLVDQAPADVMGVAINEFTNKVQKHLDHCERGPKAEHDRVWKLLEKADSMSTREFLRSKENPDGGFNFNTIEWLETFEFGTGWYDQALSETILETLDFRPSNGYCIEGGAQQVAWEMARRLRHRPEFHRQVTAIEAHRDGRMTLTVKSTDKGDMEPEKRDYFAVINSTTLGALQRMDLSRANLRYGTKQAIRSLRYGASCKVAVKFRTAWWRMAPYNITKGGIAKTDLPIRVCVYPSYNIHDNPEHEAVLLCSYTWGQDADRIGCLTSPISPHDEEALKQVIFHNLARLHATYDLKYEVVLEQIRENYITHHSYDWRKDRNSSGAFAYFGPGQFSRMWPEIIKPNGKLFLVGEAASAHHAWVVGALESAVRGVYQLLETLRIQNPDYMPYKKAMQLLRRGDGVLPFGPLPREMPMRQKGRSNKDDLTDHPREGRELSFTAAQVLMSLIEKIGEDVEVNKEEALARAFARL